MLLHRERWVVVVHMALVSAICMASRGVDGAHWGSFARDNCVQSGYRKYYSRLWGISGDWKKACTSTPTRVGPETVYFESPDVCVDKGIGGEWGEFHVRDTSCDPDWGSFKDDGCRGSSGYRQYSSVLYGIPRGESWESWCAATPATVRGILFPKPTRCVNTVFNIWGEFDIYDPCCPGTASSSASSDTKFLPRLVSSSCAGGGDEPPFPNPNKINSAADAVRALQSGNYDPLDIIEFLWSAFFQSLVNTNNAGPTDFYAIESNSLNPPILRFQGSPSSSTLSAPIRALLVPTIPGSSLVNNGGVFPAGTFATIDLANPPAPVICTQSLTGCCMAFGWDNNNGRLYMGHVEPDDTSPAVSDRVDVANFLRTHLVFPQSTTQNYREFFGGDAPPTGYAGLRVNIVGFITRDSIRIFLQMADSSRNIVRRRMMEFRRQ